MVDVVEGQSEAVPQTMMVTMVSEGVLQYPEPFLPGSLETITRSSNNPFKIELTRKTDIVHNPTQKII